MPAVEIEVSCSPKDLPEFIEVDLADMELDQVIHLSDIKAPKGVTFIALAHDSDLPVGLEGRALRLGPRGAASSLTLPGNDLALKPTRDFSVQCWIRTTATAASRMAL